MDDESRPILSKEIGAMDAFIRILESSGWAADLTAYPERFTFDTPYPNSVTPAERTRIRLIKELDRDIHDKLRSGALLAWGRPNRAAPMRPIDSAEWDDIALITDKLAFENSRHSCAMTRKNGKVCYLGVKLSRDQVSRCYKVSFVSSVS